MRLKTTELPLGEKAKARSAFHTMVREWPHVLLVVLGNDATAQETAQRADKVAGGPDDLRWVVWMKEPANHKDQIEALENSGMLTGRDTLAFCTSHDDAVCDVIEKSEAPVKFGRLLDAFAAGEE